MWQLQRERLRLDYDIVASDFFPRQAGLGRYFIVRIRNTGNKQIQDIDFSLTLKVGTIESISFSDPQLVRNLSKEASVARGLLPLLNPDEVFSATVTASDNPQGSPLQVVARAPGVTAVPRSEGNVPSWLVDALVITVVASATSAILAWYTSRRSSELSETLVKVKDLGNVSV